MLSNLFTFVKAKGSSLSLPAHGRVGARATRLFSAAHFAKQNTNSVGVQSEGEAEGGCGGNSASPEPKRSPAALLVKSRPPKKSFVFLLEEKIGRAQIKNCEQNFSLSERALASGGGANQFPFCSKKVRAKCQQTPPKFGIQIPAKNMVGAKRRLFCIPPTKS